DIGSSKTDESQPFQTEIIDFNADVTILGAGPRLHIDSTGKAIEQSGGVTFHDTGAQISVDPISNNSSGSATFATSGQGVRRISGNAAFHYGQSFAAVKITNDSARDLVIHGIQVVNPNPTPNVQVDPVGSQGFQYTTDTVGGTPTAIEIN